MTCSTTPTCIRTRIPRTYQPLISSAATRTATARCSWASSSSSEARGAETNEGGLAAPFVLYGGGLRPPRVPGAVFLPGGRRKLPPALVPHLTGEPAARVVPKGPPIAAGS